MVMFPPPIFVVRPLNSVLRILAPLNIVRSFLPLVVGRLLFFNADVPTAVLDRDDNRCNPLAPFPGRLYLQVHRCV
jgi:hypothetical protein